MPLSTQSATPRDERHNGRVEPWARLNLNGSAATAKTDALWFDGFDDNVENRSSFYPLPNYLKELKELEVQLNP